MSHILLIDDEAPFARALSIGLRARGYDLEWAATGRNGLEAAAREHPRRHLVGPRPARPRRRGRPARPACLEHHPGHRALGPQPRAGEGGSARLRADDYVTRPLGMDELVARVRTALRRETPTEDRARIVTEHFTIDLLNEQVTDPSGQPVRLTPTEWHMLATLARNPGKLISQRQLLQAVWGLQYETESNYLRSYMGRIRRKLELNPARPRYFCTEPGMGYRFVVPQE